MEKKNKKEKQINKYKKHIGKKRQISTVYRVWTYLMKIKIVYILEDENKYQNIDSEFSSGGIIIDIYFIIYIFKISIINLHYILNKREKQNFLVF